MKYNSTRGGVKGYSFEDALLSGFTSDGGILMPESIPKISPDTLKLWSKLSYKDLMKAIAPLFITEEEISKQMLDGIFDRAFQKFTIPEVVKLVELKDDLKVLELFHGPTLAFKDLALSCVGQFLEYYLEKKQQHICIVVGTSGDTGSAAIDGIKGLKWVDIVVLLPKGRCSRIQELQMTTVIEDNVHVFRVDGTSDDLDVPIKSCFTDEPFAKKHNLCSINSINWARILVQMAHYFYSYFQLCPNCDGEVEIAVPTGACGNVTAGCIAREMGLPVKFVCTVNANNIVERTICDGDFSASDHVKQTLAPAMDIQIPYNFERWLYLYSGMDVSLVKNLLDEFEKKGAVKVPPEILNKIKSTMKSVSIDDEGIKEAMKRCWDDNQYLLCPHTAVAAKYHYSCHDGEGASLPRVCIATASPAKFEEAVLAAGLTPQPTKSIKALDTKETRFVDMKKGEDWEKMLRDTIEKITDKSHNSS